MYSLVSSAVLALDLARHPSGVAVADAVDRALALTPDEIGRMAAPADDATRQRVLQAVAHEPRISTLMGSVGPHSGATVVRALNETLVGGLDDLHRMLALEVPSPAVLLAQDAATVAWAGRHAGLSDLAALGAPWTAALDPVPPALRHHPYRLGLVLDEIGRRSRDQWRRTADAHGAHRGTRSWSAAMHEACQAAYAHDRLTDVARAQLAGARQLRLSVGSTVDDAYAVGMALTAAVQAACLDDLLDEGVRHVLLSAWEAGS